MIGLAILAVLLVIGRTSAGTGRQAVAPTPTPPPFYVPER
jgi:hypothetical protein